MNLNEAALALQEPRRTAQPAGAWLTIAAGHAPRGEVLAHPSPQPTRSSLFVRRLRMEARIGAMLAEKDVMLGAIGHDLKTPLAALRVRIESVEDDAQRARMAATIEDIVRTLDEILELARIGRAGNPPERAELSALAASVVEEARAAKLRFDGVISPSRSPSRLTVNCASISRKFGPCRCVTSPSFSS